MAQIDYSRNYVDDFWAGSSYPISPDAQPGENLDWKAWLGPAPKRAWDPERYFRWRRYWDYSGGIATDLFIHRVTRIIKALNLTFPEHGVGTGGKYEFKDSKAEIPDTFNVMLDYPGGPTVLLVSSMANDTPVEHVLRGHKATLKFTRTGFTITPQPEYAKDMQVITFQKRGAEDTPAAPPQSAERHPQERAAEVRLHAGLLRRGGLRNGRAVLPPPQVRRLG